MLTYDIPTTRATAATQVGYALLLHRHYQKKQKDNVRARTTTHQRHVCQPTYSVHHVISHIKDVHHPQAHRWWLSRQLGLLHKAHHPLPQRSIDPPLPCRQVGGHHHASCHRLPMKPAPCVATRLVCNAPLPIYINPHMHRILRNDGRCARNPHNNVCGAHTKRRARQQRRTTQQCARVQAFNE